MIDPFGRHISYLRVSVTDRCDFRCVYCMAEDMTFLPKAEVLSLEELERLCGAFVRRGVRKLRMTGGEPLVRKNVMSLFRGLGRHLSDVGFRFADGCLDSRHQILHAPFWHPAPCSLLEQFGDLRIIEVHPGVDQDGHFRMQLGQCFQERHRALAGEIDVEHYQVGLGSRYLKHCADSVFGGSNLIAPFPQVRGRQVTPVACVIHEQYLSVGHRFRDR